MIVVPRLWRPCAASARVTANADHQLVGTFGILGAVIVMRTASTNPAIQTIGYCGGMKGTMSELELSLLRARSMEALKQKARRGRALLHARRRLCESGP